MIKIYIFTSTPVPFEYTSLGSKSKTMSDDEDDMEDLPPLDGDAEEESLMEQVD